MKNFYVMISKETLTVQPLDMVKTRFHLNEGKNGNVFMALRSIVKEGGFLRFYRGILPELVGNLPAASAMLSSYELFKRLLTELNGGKCTVAVVWGAGMLTSFPEATVATPFQVVKVLCKNFILKIYFLGKNASQRIFGNL